MQNKTETLKPKMLYKKFDRLPKVEESPGTILRDKTRKLRQRFAPREKTSCSIDIQKQMLEKLYTDKKDKTSTVTNPDRIK